MDTKGQVCKLDAGHQRWDIGDECGDGIEENNRLFMEHGNGFLNLVNDAKSRVKEITIEQVRVRLAANPRAVLIDVREDGEWQAGHAIGAVHLGKGILERDIEKTFPERDRELILYCGGGFRSALSADAAQKMGYQNVFSLAGGYKAMVAADWKMDR